MHHKFQNRINNQEHYNQHYFGLLAAPSPTAVQVHQLNGVCSMVSHSLKYPDLRRFIFIFISTLEHFIRPFRPDDVVARPDLEVHEEGRRRRPPMRGRRRGWVLRPHICGHTNRPIQEGSDVVAIPRCVGRGSWLTNLTSSFGNGWTAGLRTRRNMNPQHMVGAGNCWLYIVQSSH